MAWAFVGVSNVVEVTATPHALVTTGIAGLSAGDLLVACISSRIASTTSVTLPTGGEWTLVSEQKRNNTLSTSSALPSVVMAYCVRGASNPNLTFTHPVAPNVAIGRIVAYRGVDTTSPLDAQTSFITTTAITAVSGTGLTTTVANDLIVAMAGGGQEAAWSAFANAPPGFSATDKSANITLSNNNKTMATTSSTAAGIRSAASKTNGATGKHYAEVLINVTGSGQVTGLKSAAVSVTGFGTDDAYVPSSNGTIFLNGANVGSVGSSLVAADVLCIAWDASAKLIWFRKNAGNWNNNGAADPATGANGISTAGHSGGEYCLWNYASASAASVTARVVSADFTQAVPSGFVPWTATPTASGATDTATAPAAGVWLERADSLTTTGNDTSLAIFDSIKTATGVTGELTATASVSAGHGVAAGAFKILPASTNKTLDATVGATYAVTGASTTTVLLKRKIDATTGSSYALVGTDVAISKGVPPKVLTADGGSYLLTGAATTTILRRARIDATTGSSYAVTGASTTNVLHKWKIDAATTPGAYALTGTAAGLLHKYRPVALGGSYLLTGSDAAVTKTTPLVNKTLPAGGGSYAITGTDAAVIKRVFKRLTADGSSYALTGNATAVLLHRWKPAALGGTYALTGSDATITRFANKRLTADSSSYAVTGAATTTVLHKWKMVATTPASYALAGNSATFLIHKDIVSAAPGAYALTGFDVGFQIRTDKFLSAALGTYILTGTPVGLRKTWKHAAAAGSYAVTGTDAAITRRVPKTVVAASASYALSGTAASVLHRWKHAAAGGSYAVTGTAARPWYGYRVGANSSSYLVTGTAATVRKTAARTIAAIGSSYALTGTAALARRGLKLFAPIGGTYALTGDPARPWHGYKVLIGAASYSLTGAAATLSRLRKVVTAEAGTYALTGKPALVLYRWTLPAAASSYAITGTPAILRRVRTVTAAPGAYALVGSPIIINRVGLWYVVADPASYEITGNVARLFTGEWTISSRTVVVAAEDRTALAIGESRTVQAVAETRLVTVAADIRTVQAIAEIRTIQSAGESHGVSQVEQQGSRRSPRLQHRLVATVIQP